MLCFTRKTDYALVAMADLALHNPGALSARDMSDRLRVPLPVMQKVLTRLKHQGLVVSIRGSLGGYRLGKPPEEITLGELVVAVEGPFRLTQCTGKKTTSPGQPCRISDVCPITDSMCKVHDLLERFLTEVTLAQLAFNSVPIGPASLKSVPSDSPDT